MSNDSQTDWAEAFTALRRQVTVLRGTVEQVDAYDDVVRWPKTTGHDVITIAALLDPFMRDSYDAFGGHAIAAHWSACLDDIARHALRAPEREYSQNQTFWRTLTTIVVFLDAIEAPSPEEHTWDALIDAIADLPEARNAGPTEADPFVPNAKVKTFDDLFRAQFDHLRALRGVDKATQPDPLGLIPRTTNGDVVKLADYWGRQLSRVKEVSGHARTVARWKSAIAGVDQFARQGDPYSLYPKNEAFWFALRATAVQVSVADETPSKADLLFDAIKDNVVKLPDNIAAGVKAVAGAASDAAGEVADGVGKAIDKAGKGLLAGIGTPLLVGAGLLGAFLLVRRGKPSGQDV